MPVSAGEYNAHAGERQWLPERIAIFESWEPLKYMKDHTCTLRKWLALSQDYSIYPHFFLQSLEVRIKMQELLQVSDQWWCILPVVVIQRFIRRGFQLTQGMRSVEFIFDEILLLLSTTHEGRGSENPDFCRTSIMDGPKLCMAQTREGVLANRTGI